MAKRPSIETHQSWTDRGISLLNQASANNAAKEAAAEAARTAAEAAAKQQHIQGQLSFINEKRLELARIHEPAEKFLQTLVFALSMRKEKEDVLQKQLASMILSLPATSNSSELLAILEKSAMLTSDKASFRGFSDIVKAARQKIKGYADSAKFITDENKIAIDTQVQQINKNLKAIMIRKVLGIVIPILLVVLFYLIILGM